MPLGTAQRVVEDTPSEVVRLSRLELNKLLEFVAAIYDAAVAEANGDDWRTAVAALTDPGLKKIIADLERPTAPRFPTP